MIDSALYQSIVYLEIREFVGILPNAPNQPQIVRRLKMGRSKIHACDPFLSKAYTSAGEYMQDEEFGTRFCEPFQCLMLIEDPWNFNAHLASLPSEAWSVATPSIMPSLEILNLGTASIAAKISAQGPFSFADAE